MRSSYNNKDLNYGDLLKTIVFLQKPKNIVEFGILDGFSLDSFLSYKNCDIIAYDIFDEFNGNSSSKDIIKKYENNSDVSIRYGDFYKKYEEIEDNSIDILHVDIANDADVYKFAVKNYVKKIKDNGIIILEGGSEERDKAEWMIKYDKSPIKPFLESSGLNYITVGNFPSITVLFPK